MGDRTATGTSSRVQIGWREHRPGQPDFSTALEYRFLPPANLPLPNPRVESGEINNGTAKSEDLPGPRGGDGLDIGLRFSPGALIEPFCHLLGGFAATDPKVELATGVWQYSFEARNPRDYVSMCSIWAYLQRGDVLLDRRENMALSQLTFAIGDNASVRVALAGSIGHGSSWSEAVPEGANAGTYPLGPILHGPALDESTPIHVQITSLAPLRIKVEQDVAPTWAGSVEVPLFFDENQKAIFAPIVDSAGFDMGVQKGSTWDPLEIAFPTTTATDTKNLAVGDIFTFQPPGQWPMPVNPFPGGSTWPKTSAGWYFFLTPEGGSELTYRPESGTFTLGSPLIRDGASNSRYPDGWIRNSPPMASWALEKSLRSRLIEYGHRKDDPFITRSVLRGPQIGGTTFRDQLEISAPFCKITESANPVAGPDVIKNSCVFMAYEPPDSSPGLKVKIISDRDVPVTGWGYD